LLLVLRCSNVAAGTCAAVNYNSRPMSDPLAHLNPPQREAVVLPDEHALILAGAGSGKTRVLIQRIAWLLSQGVAPSAILAVTFTNKAAKEMQSRLMALVPFNVRAMWIGTFHGLCHRLLRLHHREAGLPAQFQILDAADQLAAVKRLLKSLNVDEERHPPRELCAYINGKKEKGLRAVDLVAENARDGKRIELYAAYEAQCVKEGVTDFAELLLRAWEVLARNEALRRHYRQRFRHILVDEFQDTNVLQWRWLQLLARAPDAGDAVAERDDGACLFCVGDDDQSIYRFRGAEVGNMLDFERSYHVRQVIRLEQNYRSHGNILAAANAIIEHNARRLGKNLWTERGAGEPIRVYRAADGDEEARWVVEEIGALARDGHARDEIAVLYRSNAQSRALEHALFTAGLPYRVHGGLRFFERAEIKHALAYLRLIAHADDDTSLLRVVNFPPRGIGARSLEALSDGARARGSSLAAAIPEVKGRAGAALAAFAALLEGLRTAASLPLTELIAEVIERSGLRAHYQSEKEGEERLANLEELVNAAESFVRESQSGGDGVAGPAATVLDAFLAHAALEGGEHQAGSDEDAVQLMTVHAAKGLEFNMVFICGLEEGLFPHENASQRSEDLEEERRLMYVAITRARERLYLSWASERLLHGQWRAGLPSRFIGELPPALLKWLSPVEEGRRWRSASPSPARPPATPALPATMRAPPAGGLRLGQNVRHARFGDGVIVEARGSGADQQVRVHFAEHGVKWLSLIHARLETV